MALPTAADKRVLPGSKLPGCEPTAVSPGSPPESRNLALRHALAEVGQRAAEGAGLTTLAGTVLRQAARMLGLDTAQLWVCAPRSDELRCLGESADGREAIGEWPEGRELRWSVVRSRRPLCAADLARHPLWGAAPPLEGEPRSSILLPLHVWDRPLGLLVGIGRAGRAFATDEVEALAALATSLVLAIQADRAAAGAQRSARQLAALLDLNKHLVLGVSQAQILARITDEAAKLLGVEAAGLRLVVEDHLVRVASVGLADPLMVRQSLRVGESLSGLVAARNRSIVSTNIARDPRQDPAHRARAREHGLRGWLGVPLRGRDGVLGVVFVADRVRRRFEDDEVRLLEAFADQASIAIESSRLYQARVDSERRLQELVGQLIVAQEEERRRVAYDLHDGLAQTATAAQQHLETFAALSRPRSPRAVRELLAARALAEQTVKEARRLIGGLRPTVLDEQGLGAAIRREVDALIADGWTVDYEEGLGPRRLGPSVETALFRVAQEALSNVRKHAGPTRVQLSIRRRGDTVRLEVRDQGRGFHTGQSTEVPVDGQRVGLASMRERIALLGGRCMVTSRPGGGTRVLAEVPLPSRSEDADSAG